MHRATALPLMLLALLVGCSHGSMDTYSRIGVAAPSSGVSRTGNILVLQGAITPDMARQFLSALNSGETAAVMIRSGGGDDQSAMTIGWAIHTHKLPLIVQGACMSACAHFIFVAASRRVVQPNSLVVFHNDHASIAAIADNNRSPGTKNYTASIDSLAAIEKSYYEKLGLPVALLLEPQIEIQTRCFAYVRSLSGGVLDLDFKASYTGWIPRRSLLDASGITMTGFWPSSLPQLQHAFATVFKPNAPIKILYGGGHSLMSAAELATKYAEISQCSDSG